MTANKKARETCQLRGKWKSGNYCSLENFLTFINLRNVRCRRTLIQNTEMTVFNESNILE